MKTKLWIAVIFAVLAFSLVLISPVIGSIVSTNREFNSTQDSIFLNYTNRYTQNVTLWSNATYAFTLNITNSSTSINANYSQSNTLSACQYPSISFIVRNDSIMAATQVNFSSVGNKTNVNITFETLSCLPGRYWGNFLIKNSTNATENLTINVDIHIPISASNYNSLPQTGTANMTASMPGNASTFHRYYFNTSMVNRSTSITVNFTAAQDMDIFLFDNSTAAKFLAKSINKSNSSEWLTFWPLTPDAMYEIRIYGNITNASSTSYSFFTIFSTLNSTNSTGTGQVSSIDFGNISVSGRNFTNITLRNEGNLTLNNVVESKEIYYVKRWEINTSSSSRFDGLFLVPSFASKIKIAVNWTNTSQNYSLYLTAPNRTLIGSSNEKFKSANFTNASLEEYFETAGIAQGYWNASVRHNTDSGGSNYTLAAYVWYLVSDWISTNYTTMIFNTSLNNNSNSTVNITFTVPNNSIDGNYEGFLQYTSAAGAALRIPFNASVNASSLIVNDTLNSATVQIDENIGANLTKVLNITMNNSGNYPLSFTLENSTNNSFALWNGARFINFSYQVTSSPLSPGANHVLNISMTLDPNTTKNVTGTYEGYIKFVANESRPYQNFTLTLRINLTNDLNMILSQPGSQDGDLGWINQTSLTEIFNTSLNIYYINGTGSEINNNILNTSNFTTAWLTNVNISYRIPTTGNLSISNGTNPIYGSNNKYNLNLTLPASQPGGIYQLHIGANYTRGDGYAFKGEGVYNYLYINQTGLYMEVETSPSSLSNASTGMVNVSIKNYGTLTAVSPKIKLNKGSGISTVTYNGIRGIGCAASGTDEVTITQIDANNNTGCVVSWNITAGASEATSVSTINGTAGVWFRSLQFSTSVTVPSTSPPITPGTNSGTTPTPNTTANTTTSDLTITSFPTEARIVQNTSANISISVKNSGTVNMTGVNVYVSGINQSWYVRPAAQNIGAGVEKSFSITFNIPTSAQVASYPIKYIANNSAATKNVSASLVVTPNNQTAAQINASLLNYTAKYEQLSLLLNQTKAKGLNLTGAEASMAQIKDMLDRAGAYIKGGDYYSAYQLISQIDGLLETAEAEITGATPAAAGNTWIWLIAGIAVVLIAAFIVYITLPPSHGFTPEGYKFVHPELGGKTKLAIAKEKIGKLIEKVKGKFSKKQQHPPQAYVYRGSNIV